MNKFLIFHKIISFINNFFISNKHMGFAKFAHKEGTEQLLEQIKEKPALLTILCNATAYQMVSATCKGNS